MMKQMKQSLLHRMAPEALAWTHMVLKKLLLVKTGTGIKVNSLQG